MAAIPKFQRIFLGYQFKSKWYNRADLIAAFEEACEIAEEDLRKQFPGIRLDPKHEATQIGQPLSKEIISVVRGSSAGVFELSDNNPNVMYELGILYGQGLANPIILRRKGAKTLLPSDIRGIFHLPYQGVDGIKGRLARSIERIIRKQVEVARISDTTGIVRSLWAGPKASRREITIVCPVLPRKYRPRFANPQSREYVELARFGDVDALVEILSMLPVLYPDSTICRLTSDEVSSTVLKNDLIILGGPDFNSVAADVIDRVNLPIRYRTGQTDASFEDTVTKNRYDLLLRSNKVKQDFGLFARFPNPFNPQRHIVMIGGLQTFGVLGTAKAFGLNAAGRSAARKILNRSGLNPRFAAIVNVPVVNSHAQVGRVDFSSFHIYPW